MAAQVRIHVTGIAGFLGSAVAKALIAEGWHQSVPGEPWHYSYHVVG